VLTRALHLSLSLGKFRRCDEARLLTLLAEDPGNPIALCATIQLYPEAPFAAREVARLRRQYPGWTLPKACLEAEGAPRHVLLGAPAEAHAATWAQPALYALGASNAQPKALRLAADLQIATASAP
jgi:hypothetical protein